MKLFVVGMGPGQKSQMTFEAFEAMQNSDVIIGYDTYIDLVRELFPGKAFRSTPMRREIERCRLAVEEACSGKTVSMICSGDAGVYGMAEPVLRAAQKALELDVEIIPGITAACSGAALLGAPLTHDFAVISLSDLLTPWEKIETRLRCAAEADFVLCIYNPSSKKRADYLQKACDIVLRFRKPETVCGVVRNIGREGSSAQVMPLSALREYAADMFTTVFIGNSQTHEQNGKILTPRGYLTELER